LDLAFGRTNVIHAALLAGPASQNLMTRVDAWLAYRGEPSHAGRGDAITELESSGLRNE
jgi:hypothetical protein